MRSLFPITLKDVTERVETSCYVAEDHTVIFNGDCEECRPHCGSLCCISYGYVTLSEEEALSGRYQYKAVTEGCECESCENMRKARVLYSLLKKADYSCLHLESNGRCGIYEYRPQTCRNYSCKGIIFPLLGEL